MNLVIDVGNTRTKYAFFKEKECVEVGYESGGILDRAGDWKKKGEKIEVFLSGSGKIDGKLKQALQEAADFWLIADPSVPLPLRIGYSTPETLGFDRIAICVGAKSLFPGKSLLVIDSGTALTFNYVDCSGTFLGGNISPGLEMRLQGLHHFTARLPYVLPAEVYGGIGRTTETAIRNGVMCGMLFEVERYMMDFREQHLSAQIVITGGNSKFLRKSLGNRAYFNDCLGFIGLNEILEYTKKF